MTGTLDTSFGPKQGLDDQHVNAGCPLFVPYTTHTLRGEGFDASEDGTGRGTPLVPVGWDWTPQQRLADINFIRAARGDEPLAFDTTQITSVANRSSPKSGDPCHPLAAGAHAPAIAFHPTQDPISSTDGTTHCMGTGSKQGNSTVAVAVAHVSIMPTMTAGGPSESSHNQVSGQMRDAYMVPTTAMQVRRLTPRECERLQGFPDDYTAIPWRGKPASECPDGPRYKALGNSWAVPVARWIGRRVDAALRRAR